jgi:RHH-type transcriptional regulator, rel operon repressor / antitoxin RelB
MNLPETPKSAILFSVEIRKSDIDDFADVQIALDRLRDQKDPVLSSREMRQALGL